MSASMQYADTSPIQHAVLLDDRAPRRVRRGAAVFLVLIITIASAALAASAILLGSGARLVTNYRSQERDLIYGADAALQVGTTLLTSNPFVLPETSYVQLSANAPLIAADGTVIPNVVYDLYAGPTGAASRQLGRFVTVVAVAKDTLRHRQFVRRVELNQETFARYAYFSVSENGICFGSGDRLLGPVFSDDVISTCGGQQAEFMDSVDTPQTFVNGNPALDTLYDGWTKVARPLLLPSGASLATLFGLAAAGNTVFTTPNVATDSTSVIRSRLEFVAYDLNGDGDSTQPGEGFVKFYQVDEGTKSLTPQPTGAAWSGAQLDSVAIGYLRSGISRQHDVNDCGEWREVFDDNGNLEWEFFPIAVHSSAWYKTIVGAAVGGLVPAAVSAANAQEVTVVGMFAPADTISVAGTALNPLRNGSSSYPPRCYAGGDPHLVAIERDTSAAAPLRAGTQWSAQNWTYGRRGGTDTTFTGGDASDPAHPTRMGHWLPWPGPTPAPFTPAFQAAHPDWRYLYPIDKTYNPSFTGVVAVHGSVGLSGIMNGHVTVYTDGSAAILDNLLLTNAADTTCQHLFGILAGHNILAADNGINAPAGTNVTRLNMRGGSSSLWVQSTVMALGSWGAEGLVPDAGVLAVPQQQPCNASLLARGCLNVQGSIIQTTRQTVNGGGYGYQKAYAYDECAAQNPLPFFPTTGRFTTNNYYETDPVHFNVAALYAALAR
jgi:hypothetical protein